MGSGVTSMILSGNGTDSNWWHSSCSAHCDIHEDILATHVSSREFLAISWIESNLSVSGPGNINDQPHRLRWNCLVIPS